MSPARKPQPHEAAAALNTNYLRCRDLGHAWEDYTAEWAGEAFRVTVVCYRCDARRTRFVQRNGFYAEKHGGYDYPKDYQVPEVNLRNTEGRAAVRFELLNRQGVIYGKKVSHIGNGKRRA